MVLCWPDGRIADVNRAAERITGRSRDALLGAELSELFADPHEARLVHRRVMTHGDIHNVALTMRDPEGLAKSVLYSATRYRDDSGRWHGVLATARVVARPELTEARLRELAILQGAGIDSASHTVFCTDAQGTIRVFNRTSARKLGRSSAEVVDTLTPLSFHDPVEVARHAEELSRRLGRTVEPGLGVLTLEAELGRPGEPHDREWTYVSTDGRRVSALVSVTALRDGRGTITGFLYVGRDITRRKEIERLKDQLLATVSHELRTPLASIRGALGLLEADTAGVLSDRAHELLQIARINADRLIRLVDQSLDLEKVEAGTAGLFVEALDAEELVTATLRELGPAAEQTGVRLAGDVSFREPVRADRDRIVQVLTNLLSNAVRFSRRGNAVVLRVARSSPARVRFAVTDHGPGIPADQLPRLFRRFQQLDAADGRQRGGAGLGLAISKAIVEQHGGEIGVESTVGVGSTFWFELRHTPAVALVPSAAGVWRESAGGS